jgi:hypothetical protein
MAGSVVRAWHHWEARTQPRSTSVDFSDDGLDFPPAAHPVRELISFSIFMLVVTGLVVWGGSKLL